MDVTELSPFAVGQEWEFAAGDGVGVLVIGDIEWWLDREWIAHVSLIEPIQVGHLPIATHALRASVTAVRRIDATVGSEFSEGIESWRTSEGGVWSITLAEILRVTSAIVQQSSDDTEAGGRQG